jgi:hypothetical protein
VGKGVARRRYDGHSGLSSSVQPALVTVVIRVPQPTTEGCGAGTSTPSPWVRSPTAPSCAIRTGLPESPLDSSPTQAKESLSQSS